jgi:hypothetical protein
MKQLQKKLDKMSHAELKAHIKKQRKQNGVEETWLTRTELIQLWSSVVIYALPYYIFQSDLRDKA